MTTNHIDPHLVGVRLAIEGQTLAEQRLQEAVALARAAGARWKQVAALTGCVTPGAARYRYGPGLEARRARHREYAARTAA